MEGRLVDLSWPVQGEIAAEPVRADEPVSSSAPELMGEPDWEAVPLRIAAE